MLNHSTSIELETIEEVTDIKSYSLIEELPSVLGENRLKFIDKPQENSEYKTITIYNKIRNL